MSDPTAKRQKTGGAVFPPWCVAVASSKGRKLTLEDVPVVEHDLGGTNELSFYGILDGHGGRTCADEAAQRLPALIYERVRGVVESAAIKEAVKAAFEACERELLELAQSKGWDDGCCAIGVLIDRRATPARGYVANLGDSRACACVVPVASTADPSATGVAALPVPRSVALSKDHHATDPKERKRIEASGGWVENGRACGMLEVSRSLGDRKLKEKLKVGGVSASPDVSSFAIGPEQRFLLLACDGFWKAYTSDQTIEVRAESRAGTRSPRHSAPASMEADAVEVATAGSSRACRRRCMRRCLEWTSGARRSPRCSTTLRGSPP